MFKRFYIDRSVSPLVQQSETICAILVEGTMENSLKSLLNLDQWFNKRCHLKQKFMDGHMLDEDRLQELTLSLWLT